jgi:glycerol-3-phosphate O-acyltransferase
MPTPSATLDEVAIRREAARRAAEESIVRARAGQEALEETLNDCLYHADRRARTHQPDAAEARVLEGAQEAIQSRDPARLEAATHALCERYAAEIGGDFDPRMYALASWLAPGFLSLLLSATSLPRLLLEGLKREDLDQRLVIDGEVGQLSRLARAGTIVCTPAHTSHMDSLVMGYALQRSGLPRFVYGAGKNLFQNPLLGFFLQHLGTYKVDRLKDEALYKRTLKNYCVATLTHGLGNLFFPGGTRSRSGALEQELKLGLLGCGLEAYIANLQAGRSHPRIFIVPATVSYQIVLEAETLIGDYLSDEGQSRYIIDDDEVSRPTRIAKFITALLAMDGQIHVRFGRALDPFGNEVDDEGRSLDPHGRVVDERRYVFDADGRPVLDAARDRQYTRELGGAIVERFQSSNTALPTHVTCFAAMQALVERSGEQDLYRVLRSRRVDDGIPVAELHERVARLLGALREKAQAGRLCLPAELGADAGPVVAAAERALALYHLPPPLERRDDLVHVRNRALVYYYRNRLAGYGLDTFPFLEPRARKGNRR